MKRWYVPLFLLLFTAFVPWMKEAKRVSRLVEIEQVKIWPDYSVEKIQHEFQWVKSTEQKWNVREDEILTATSPKEYWDFLDRNWKLEDAMKRFLAGGWNTHSPEVESRLKSLTTLSPISIINFNFQKKFGINALHATRPGGSYIDFRHNIPDVPNTRLELFISGYLLSIPIMLVVFCIRLRVRDLIVWVELWRLIPISLFWPVGLCIYPMDVKRKQQLRQAAHVVSYATSAILGCFGFGTTVPLKAQVGPSNGKTTTGEKSEKRGSFGYGIELYPMTNGIDSGGMISPWYSYKENLGKGFSLSGYGFVEAGERKAQLFTNHATTISNKKWHGAMFTTELGATPSGSFVQVSPRVNLIKIPGIGREVGHVMKSVVAGHVWRVRGPTLFHEHYLSWISKEFPIGKGLTLATEGFMRFRVGSTPTVGEPQVLLRHKKWTHIDFVTEFWMINLDPTIRVGIQLH